MSEGEVASKLTIVIPCFNEARSLRDLIEKCQEIVSEHAVEFIFVDNGSNDETQEIFHSLLKNEPKLRAILLPENQGYGGGILAGLAHAETEFIGWTHADLQTDPADAVKALRILDDPNTPKNVLVKGRRMGRSLGSVFFTFGMSMFETLLFRTIIRDVNAQPTIFRRDFFLKWKDAPTDFALDLYAYVTAKTMGFQVRRFEVPFVTRKHGVSNWNVGWRSRNKFIVRTVRFSFALRRGM